MEDNGTMNQKEKTMGFAYVIILFLTITIACCLLLFLNNSGYNTYKQKDFIISKMERVKDFRETQKQAMTTVNDIHDRINNFNPGINAVYEEDNIKYMIRELKNIYEKNQLDTRYKSFMHLADYYYMWYADKKTLWSKNENINRFQKDLQECELGLQSKKDDYSKLRR